MTFRGLFIGIDRFASPAINWLSCAARDATALHALFTDNFGGEATLLLDTWATRSAIVQKFEKLKASAEDDIVVVAFSGHGSETHELVTYDADISDLSGTCIPLDELGKWFGQIRARHVICILDCCFSGGMGARALQVDAVPRNIPSTQTLLEQLSGKGRIVFAASQADERAWENQRFGHGLLTYYLLEGLLGPEAIVVAGKLPVYRLLEYVTLRVIDAAKQIRKVQQPAIRGSIDGELNWPVLKPGPIFKSAFPERQAQKATEDVYSLRQFGFPEELLKAWAGPIPKLNQLQLDAINEFGVLEGEHLVVSAPTSSGKTMVGELAALRGVTQRRRAFFLFPLKALANDKQKHFQYTYGQFGVRTIRATGDSTTDEILPLMRGQYDICLLTYEKFSSLILGNPYLLEQVGTIVIDEVQMVADRSRGVNLEFIMTLLRMRRSQDIEPQCIALSAVVGDTNGLERWLGARLLRRLERPVPLDEGILQPDGGFRFISSETSKEDTLPRYIQPEYHKGSSQDYIIPLVRKLISEGKQVIVFRETRGEARGTARYLASALGLPPARSALDSLPQGDPSIATENLREALMGGCAFHISDLDPEERLLVEEHFRARPTTLRMIAATTTLAMGVNTPAECVVVAGLNHPGNEPYSIAEYKNIVGRAGRLGFSEKGYSYLIALDAHTEHSIWNKYVLGKPEDLQSQFLSQGTDPRSLILRVLVAAQRAAHEGLNAADIIEFLENSFGAFQEKQRVPGWQWDRQRSMDALSDLHRHSMVELDEKSHYRLTELGRLSGESGVEVESIIRVVDALRGADPSTLNDPTLIAATQLTVELDNVLFPMNRKSTQKEPQTWMAEIRRQNVAPSVMRTLQRFVQDEFTSTLRAKKTAACLLWITDTPISRIEEILTQFGGKFDGAAGPLRGLKSRTCDLLPTVVRIGQILHPTLNLGDRVVRLLTRLEIGLPAGMVDVAFLLGTGLSRGDYLSLLAARLMTLDDLEKASDETILKCVGGEKSKLAALRKSLKERVPQGPPIIEPILPPYTA